ncbi:hypothetical protein FGE12_11505 [Aggregicoccus sp. 17bor-14]|uniref:hypothetical protein n=1 Tax=Myxococcaceae TaxID=31 RepID=UPI00129C509E|nr:hypothetical protein [Simulacricoccus sp. 17bor-14]MRI88776.1 hypothetical protein [Aggregicoccus sp. 17bor-14]
MMRTIVLIAALALAGATACGTPSADSVPHEGSCRRDSDCASGLKCQKNRPQFLALFRKGTCAPVCESDIDCGEGRTCVRLEQLLYGACFSAPDRRGIP